MMAIDESQTNKETIMNYNEMTNAELSSVIDDLGIEVEAKNPSKPNKTEMISALNEFDGVTPEVETTEVTVAETEPLVKKKTKAQTRKEQYTKMQKLVRVNVTSNSQSQSKPIANQVMTISWGNRLGYHTDRLVLGKPWHIRYGALDNLRGVTITQSVQNDEKNRVDTQILPAYNIVELPQLTKPELTKMAKRQTIRDESLEALVDD